MANTGLITIVAPLDVGRRAAAAEIIESWGNRAGEAPATADLARRLAASTVHFMSAHALDLGGEARLYFEISADGADDVVLGQIASAMQPEFAALLAGVLGAAPSDVGKYLMDHRVEVGSKAGLAPGLAFRGVPGPTAEIIHRQADLARAVTELLGEEPPHRSALDRIDAVRRALKSDGRFDWTTQPPPWPRPEAPPPKTLPDILVAVAPGFVATFLRTALLLALGFAFGVTVVHYLIWRPVLLSMGEFRAGLNLLAVLFGATLLGVAGVLAWVVSVIYRLTRLEASDAAVDRAPDAAVNAAIFGKENQGAQNHMISVTARKPGGVRVLTLRFAFWVIGEIAPLQYTPGFLGPIGTIHFARWVSIPGTDKLVFTSNFGGSWESYLEDFITLAHAGLTAVWSNTVGFPKTSLLFQNGATDGERFKRYARRSMIPTLFWYSAYPNLTTANIRTNGEIHRGLAVARTEDEARDWLGLFGSAVRPAPKLETDEIQSLIFGGLGFLHNGSLVLAELSEEPGAARACLADLAPYIAFNDGRRFSQVEVISLAMSAKGLRRLGLNEAALASFPLAFTGGITGPGRDRILGDQGANARHGWAWGGEGEPDIAILSFAPGEELRDPDLTETVVRIVERAGGRVLKKIPFDHSRSLGPEPFGFADGVSQPVIRDTYRALRSPDPLHVVEPGEFILGYPDNRGNLPPGPTLPAAADPAKMLPLAPHDGPADVAPRAFAQNGSYLVIRQLAQDVDAFHAYCETEAGRLAGRLGPPNKITPEFIGAKLVGRWPNGSSLVRNPYDPAESSGPRMSRTISNPEVGDAIPASPAGAAEKPDNDFLYGTEDPQALRCPFGAHTRRANPRDSLNPGSQDQIDISNRHRILRVGRRYTDAEGQGLMFMGLNGDLERQFEFIQQTWLSSPSFHGLSCEQDALVGSGDTSCNGFTIPSHDGPIRLSPLSRFVTVRGGGYFFLPSLSLVRYLSGADSTATATTPLTVRA